MPALFKNKTSILKGSITLFLLTVIINLFFTAAVLAQTPSEPPDATSKAINILDDTAAKAQIINEPGTAPTVAEIIGDIINIMLGIVGLFFFGLVIYGGVTWLTAGGSEEKASKAVKVLTESSIGIILIIVAFLFVNLIVFKVIGMVTG